jgi:hypothetical protein
MPVRNAHGAGFQGDEKDGERIADESWERALLGLANRASLGHGLGRAPREIEDERRNTLHSRSS